MGLASMLAHRLLADTEIRTAASLIKPYQAAIPASTNDTRLLWTVLNEAILSRTGNTANAALLLQAQGDDTKSIILPSSDAKELEKKVQGHAKGLESIEAIKESVEGIPQSSVPKLEGSAAAIASLDVLLTFGLALMLPVLI